MNTKHKNNVYKTQKLNKSAKVFTFTDVLHKGNNFFPEILEFIETFYFLDELGRRYSEKKQRKIKTYNVVNFCSHQHFACLGFKYRYIVQ